jgi:F-type H+-transporting ATPase subunit a
MEEIGERAMWFYWPGTDVLIPLGGVNYLTVFNTLLAMVALWLLLWLGARRFAMVPTRGQALVEMLVTGFDGLVSSSLELGSRRANRKFLALIFSLFIFLLLCNFMGFLPGPWFEEPTADINTTLSLGIMGMVIATYCGIRAKGGVGYLEELAGPLWSAEEGAGAGAKITGKLSAIFFFPLNVIGELSKIISISFRIFGNILGGAIIITVVSHLTFRLLFPLGLDAFFIFFVGAIQAFVFTMLTLTYIAVAVK